VIAAFVVGALIIIAVSAALVFSLAAAPKSKAIKSCNELSKSTPSGYYQVRASDGSTIRVYCGMKKTCRGVAGG